MGHLLNWLEACAPCGGPARLLYGLGVALALPLGWSCLARAVEQRTPWPVQALFLKPTFAGRALLQAGRRVEVALEASDLAQARAELRSLVSRPTSSLDAALIAGAQKVEHYEMASYGCVRTWARQLGDEEAANLLQQTLDEEAETDKKLTQLAESMVNLEAAHQQ